MERVAASDAGIKLMLQLIAAPQKMQRLVSQRRGILNWQIVCKQIEHVTARRPFSSVPLANAYQPKLVESNKLDDWTKTIRQPAAEGCVARRGTFRMILPPPNVTGKLHLGHALNATIQDAICRHYRQLGVDVEWIPGMDHAGIATQVVVEKKLQKERGVTRQKLGREAFLHEVWKWKNEKGRAIVDDLKKLGCTLDWDKEYFTMDEPRVKAVNAAFIRLFDEGLIRRQNSLVNWSCALESTISDIEVETLELKGETEISVPGYRKNIVFGRLYNIGYRVCDCDEQIIVSTTRPETMLGDVAVAVHPTDERYKKYRQLPNVRLWHPFREESIPLIFDVDVEPEFGTGAVKLTPAHDKKDFEMAGRHFLEAKRVFNEQGNVLKDYEVFKNLPRFEARERILEKLAELQLLHDVKEHAMNLPICGRSKDVIEYMLRPQWFLLTESLAELAISEVSSGRMQIVPANFETEWHRWLEDCRDWCISRQLWWGHKIPAYYATGTDGTKCWVAANNEAEAVAKATQHLNCTVFTLKQDADVLDTWFSSALLPLSVYNWPNAEYENSYPLSLMETGHDILFFWVARMTMLGLKLTGKAPFKKVLLNGIVCDARGRKMSKSLGNVVTPQQVVQGAVIEELQSEIYKSYESGVLNADELKHSFKGLQKMFPHGIPECGTDALRFTLLSHNIKSHFINFDVIECHTNKLFLNKIWQATRFTLAAAKRLDFPLFEIQSMNYAPLSIWDRWILVRLAKTLKICSESFENHNLHTATAALKQFFYANLCDVYVETTKTNISAANLEGFIHCATLTAAISWGLQAMMPFTPFIVAELLQHLPTHIEVDMQKFHNSDVEIEVNEILEVCHTIRQLKSSNKISKKHEPQVTLIANAVDAADTLKTQLDAVKMLTQTSNINVELRSNQEKRFEQKYDFYSTAGHLCSFGIVVNDKFQRLFGTTVSQKMNEGKLQKLQAELERYRMRVESEGFRRGASIEIQKKHLEKIKQLEVEIENIKAMAS